MEFVEGDIRHPRRALQLMLYLLVRIVRLFHQFSNVLFHSDGKKMLFNLASWKMIVSSWSLSLTYLLFAEIRPKLGQPPWFAVSGPGSAAER